MKPGARTPTTTRRGRGAPEPTDTTTDTITAITVRWQPVPPGEALDDGEHMRWTCSIPIGPGRTGNTITQGGRRGLRLHQVVASTANSTTTRTDDLQDVTFTRLRGGVAITTATDLCPKLTCHRVHVHYWSCDPHRPSAAVWTEDRDDATVYPTETAAADAFNAAPARRAWYRTPAPQLDLFAE